MVKEGIPFVVVPTLIAIAFAFFGIWTAVAVFLFLSAFMVFFFRDPKRVSPEGDDIIVSAADGRVTRIEDNERGKLVSVFLSPLDVHINRAPIAGRIDEINYQAGRKMPATNDKASLENERNSLTIKGAAVTVVCTQIAGILARRIVCWPKAGETLQRGQKFGLIKFSSRTDVLMPSNSEVLVKVGDRVRGGETILAKLPGAGSVNS